MQILLFFTLDETKDEPNHMSLIKWVHVENHLYASTLVTAVTGSIMFLGCLSDIRPTYSREIDISKMLEVFSSNLSQTSTLN